MIQRIRLTNIQSWGSPGEYDEDPDTMPDSSIVKEEENHVEVIDFLNGINVIKGRSEKGKTVIAKPFYQMAFPESYRSGGVNKLVRRGHNFGTVEIWTSTNAYIKFTTGHKKTQQFYEMKVGDGKLVKYNSAVIPRDVNEHLGLLINYDLHKILNVYLKEFGQIPFGSTSKVWNGETLKEITSDPDSDLVYSRMAKLCESLESQVQSGESYLKKLQRANNKLEYKDPSYLREAREQVEMFAKLAKQFETIGVALENLEIQLGDYEKAKANIFNLDSLRDTIECLKELNHLEVNFGKMKDSFRYLDLEDNLGESISNLYQQKELFDKLCGLENIFDTYGKDLLESERLSQVVEDAKTALKLGKQTDSLLGNLGKYVGDFQTIETSLRAIQNTEGLEALGETCESVGSFAKNLHNLHSSLVTLFRAQKENYVSTQERKKCEEELDKLREEYQVCPVCGNPLMEGGESNE